MLNIKVLLKDMMKKTSECPCQIAPHFVQRRFCLNDAEFYLTCLSVSRITIK